MFPHNSSSHEISIETNAFVQNSKGDVVLEESSLSGAREGERPEHARYCDIKFINSSMMAAPTSYPKATVANDFITVLPRHSGELSFAIGGEACQSVASETTKNSTNHLLTSDNNDKIINNHNNAEHNHHKHRKQNTPGSLGQLGSSAGNSKSTSKRLSDNKDSFSDVSVRVLKLSVHVNDKTSDACRTAGVPSLVRIPKSDCPWRLPRLANIVDNYFLLGSRLYQGDNNNRKANISLISNNNSKSVILLSSTRYGDYYLFDDVTRNNFARHNNTDDNLVILLENNSYNRLKGDMKLLGDKCSLVTIFAGEATAQQLFSLLKIQLANNYDTINNTHLDWIFSRTKSIFSCAQNFMAQYASSSITLIVFKNEFIDHTLQFFLDNLFKERAISPNITSQLLWHVTVSKLTQRICVPLLFKNKNYDDNLENNYNNNIYYYYSNTDGSEEDDDDDDDDDDDEYVNVNTHHIGVIEADNDNREKEIININNNNHDVIEDNVNVNVCYKTSCVMTANVSMLGSQNDGISRTEATIFTVGALSFQDNDKSNKPLNDSFKNYKYQVSAKVDHESNVNNKSISKSTLSDKSSDKSEMSHQTRFNAINDGNDEDDGDFDNQYNNYDEKINYKNNNNNNNNNNDNNNYYYNYNCNNINNNNNNDDDDDNGVNSVRSAVNIPTLTTCEPTMTLKCQSATVTSQTNSVPVSRDDIENHSNDNTTAVKTALISITNQFVSNTNDYISLNNNCYSKKDERINMITNNFDHEQDEVVRPHTLNRARLIALVRALILAYQKAYKINESMCESQRNELKMALHSLFGDTFNSTSCHYDTLNDPIMGYKHRWGIPSMLFLAGGGESSLNTGSGSNWGSAPATTPNNNNANQSGWGGTPGNAPPPQANWANNNISRAVTGNSNQNPNQVQPGNPTNTSSTNKVNNPTQSSNSQSGPPSSQPANSSQTNPNTGQWPQGKSNTSVGTGQNSSTPNNNNVPSQSGSANANNSQVNNPTAGTVPTSGSPATTNPSTKQQLEQLNTIREALFSQDGWGCQHVNQDSSWDVPTSPEPSATKDGVPMWKPPVNNGTDLWDANIRNGGQPQPSPQAKAPWGHTPSTNIGGTWGEDDEVVDSSNVWTGAPTPSQPNTTQWTGSSSNQTGSSWGDPRIDPRDPRDMRSVDPREMRDPRDHRMPIDPRDHMRVMDPMTRDPRMTDMRGDPRGISGRLNGASTDTMWGQSGPSHHQMSHQHSSGPPTKMLNPSSMHQWTAPPPPKEMMPGKPTSGWEEPSPPTQRRNVNVNVANYDDGTNVWGNSATNQRGGGGGGGSGGGTMPGSKVLHWKDLPTPNLSRGGMQCPPGMPQNRMPGQPGMKPDVGGLMWSHSGVPNNRNGSWGDGPHESTNWDEPKTPASWNEPPINPSNWGGPSTHKPKSMGPSGSWGENDMEQTPSWGYPTKPALTKEVIWNSREFRYLCDLGYKKDDVEAALRNREMNRDEAQELLSQLRSLEQWRRHDTPSGYGDPSSQANMSATYPKISHVAQQMSFPPASRTPQNPPSTQQLRMLVQQIQLAVQEGYLNQQILNQPLAPSTLILLNQLLQQIKVLQQLHQQHSVQSSLKGNSQTVLQISVQITKTKQQIANLQNQIAVQQATYMKQQQQQQHPTAPSQSSDYYKTSVHDPMSALQNTFSDLAVNKEPPVSHQQSRLNQWKLPSLDKDGDITGNEFSRAPGTTSKPPSTPSNLSHSHSSPNINPLLGQGDGTWSTRLDDSGWPDAGNNDSTDGKDWQPGGAAFTDLVPEFEPGKPWKMKNIEDDPSITPGSVVRSLSLAAIKDPDAIFSSSTKTSPPPQVQNVDTSIPSLSNSTWSFNPPVTTPSTFSSSKNSWTDSAPTPTTVTSELWGVPMNKARQGPPPGLGTKSITAVAASNGWAGLGGVSRSSTSWQPLQVQPVWLAAGTWLLLKNLTPQIDGSTLKTLCMQHGPVQDFRLYLNHGIALTKYSSRVEASKAQGALNNCVLGNTTIFAESPADSEVHTLLQQLSHGGQQQTSASGGNGWGLRPTNKAGPPPDTWGGSSSQLWGAPPTSNSLWSNSGIDSSDAQRTTPSSLNSYLPGDLLGGESM